MARGKQAETKKNSRQKIFETRFRGRRRNRSCRRSIGCLYARNNIGRDKSSQESIPDRRPDIWFTTAGAAPDARAA